MASEAARAWLVADECRDEITRLRAEVGRLERLAWGVVANARNTMSDVPVPRWACVMKAIGCGSGTATRLCIEHGRDPDDALTREDGEG